MTTTSLATPPLTTTSRSRIGTVVRLHFVNPHAVLGMPWLILGAIFAGNLAIWAIILASAPEVDRADISDGLGWSGAVSFIFVYMMVVAVTAINATFPLALGYGVTRRDYYLGTALTFVILAVTYSVGLGLLGWLETVTGGWGLGGHMFSANYFGDVSAGARLFIYFALLMFFLFTGSVAAAIWVRWKGFGLTVFFIGLAFLLIGLLALIGLTDSWAAVGDWFATMGWVGSYAWSLVITAIAAVAGFFILRRATPRS